ncbi:MAG: hypothetical protein H7245_05855 [Candidatus Saccharibacteria bacterium]|nr:hypothetical protein [Pseudorhodobacter sp.]
MSEEAPISYVLMLVTGTYAPPTLADAAKQLGVDLADCDSDFGVVTINPDRQLYSVRVDAKKLPEGGDGESGPFSDPPIAPMGPT